MHHRVHRPPLGFADSRHAIARDRDSRNTRTTFSVNWTDDAMRRRQRDQQQHTHDSVLAHITPQQVTSAVREALDAINMMHSGRRRRRSCHDVLPFAVSTALQSPALAAFLKAFAGEKWRYGEGLFVSARNVFSIFHSVMQSSNVFARVTLAQNWQKLAARMIIWGNNCRSQPFPPVSGFRRMDRNPKMAITCKLVD